MGGADYQTGKRELLRITIIPHRRRPCAAGGRLPCTWRDDSLLDNTLDGAIRGVAGDGFEGYDRSRQEATAAVRGFSHVWEVRMSLRVTAALGAAAIICLLPSAAAAHALETQETWTCELDLHQGDTGVLEFSVTGGTIEGRITVKRGPTAGAMTTNIKGSWSGDDIKFTRTLSPATTIQPFVGVAVQAEDDVRMAGRFAARFAGVWSASCPTGGRSLPDDKAAGGGGAGGGGGGGGKTPPGPALTVRVDPATPSAEDRVRILANAKSSGGTRFIVVHVNDKVVNTCRETADCDFIGGPFPPGALRWRVTARSRDGGQTVRNGQLVVRPVASPEPAVGSCSIAGAAVGPRAGVAEVFGVMLFGPNNEKLFRARQALGSGQYRFDKLPAGRYVLIADTKADVLVDINPRRREVVCGGAAITGMNFEFR
jgi:hypothetical protein